MGLTDSKIAAEVVSKACSNAEKSGKDDIKAVLTDPKVLDLLHSLWSNLPDTTKSKIDPGTTKRKVDGRPEDDRPKKVRKLRKSLDFKIALVPDFMAKVSTWSEDPLSFFNEGEIELTRSPFNEMNTYMSKLVKRTGMDTVRLRFLKVMYYRLSGCVGWTQLHHKRTERMAQTVSNSCLLAWIDEGKRIDKLCRDIGCVEEVERSDQYFHLGNLFHSLQDVPDYFIKELPLQKDPRPEEVARLKSRSSLSETGNRRKLEILAHNLTDTIWNAFQNAESGLEPKRHPVGYSLGQDAQSPSRPLRQDGSTPDDFGTGVPVCSTEVATLDHERNSLNVNLQSTLRHSPGDGILPHGGISSVPQPTSQLNLEQNDGIIDEATSLSPNTPQRQGSPSPGLQATLVSSIHASPVANFNFSAFADPFPASDFPHGIFNDLPGLPPTNLLSSGPLPAGDLSGTPKGSSANFAITAEPERCSTNSVAPSGSLRESLACVPF